ncbi:MAG: DUF3859 domain-containing protein [Planctomycetota bacterium]
MAKKRPTVREMSYGFYKPFEAQGKALPMLSADGAFATRVPAPRGQEFGYILKVKHGRGMRLTLESEHPAPTDTRRPVQMIRLLSIGTR